MFGQTDNTSQRYLVIQSPSAPLWCDQYIAPGKRNWLMHYAYRTYTYTGAATALTLPPFAAPNTFYSLNDWDGGTHVPPTFPIGRAGGQDWAYVPYGTAFWAGVSAFEGPAANFGGYFQVEIDVYDGQDFRTIAYDIGTSGSAQIRGWFGVTYQPLTLGDPTWARLRSVTNHSASFDITGAGDLQVSYIVMVMPFSSATIDDSKTKAWRALLPLASSTLIDGKASVAPYNTSRLTAASLLLTNVTAELSKEGSILAARLNPSQYNVFNFSKRDMSEVSNKEKANLPLHNGLYTFVAPEVLELTDHVTTRIPVISGASSVTTGFVPVIHLDNLPYANCIMLSDQNPSSVSMMNVTFCMHLEFMTSLQLFPVGYSRQNLDSYHAALVALAGTGFFFENPTHWAAVVSAIKRALSASWPVLKPALLMGAKAAGASLLSSL